MSKILELEALVQELHVLQHNGTRVVFTNGCFDILHVGHVRYLTAARAKGDLLVVGLNSDESVKLIKGKKRPIVSQEQRAEVLISLECVDYVTIFDEADPLNLIQTIKPDVLVKGADWAEKDIIGADFVKANGGKVKRISVVPDASTTDIIQKIIQKYN
ncbi:D-glycero-beta-D-manno-heptose 1-phosphate adenylyltransferase [Desulfonema magnum]|uniref:D-glycero-beta-D-manno-heptose 1-phosphate adenylyltransferase n=1 Tax=Desulfonema magnum TaxID=45655 RepID=A0A975BQ05_9BACT|nr:D-glycero-beta-D-manno-heptose 1-phosphate adenylyltransferase [Desulfonema magnum]QTA89587.1 Bifunctional protein RfaE domain II-containing protein [Desulfonema magnum]